MSVPLDPLGNISLVYQVVILFLLILSLPFVRGMGGKKNLMRNGYLTVLALTLQHVLNLAFELRNPNVDACENRFFESERKQKSGFERALELWNL
jgi:hypothetical protein